MIWTRWLQPTNQPTSTKQKSFKIPNFR